jgi:hypothetical protein
VRKAREGKVDAHRQVIDESVCKAARFLLENFRAWYKRGT